MMNSIPLAFSSFHIYELRLSVRRRKGRIENASVLFFKFDQGKCALLNLQFYRIIEKLQVEGAGCSTTWLRTGRSTWSNTQRRGRH
jgi:hypothetical protein